MLLAVVADHTQTESIRRLPQQLSATPGPIRAIELMPGGGVVDEAALGGMRKRESAGELIAHERLRPGTPHLVGVVVAVRSLDTALRIERRLPRRDVEYAGCRVFTEQRPLR